MTVFRTRHVRLSNNFKKIFLLGVMTWFGIESSVAEDQISNSVSNQENFVAKEKALKEDVDKASTEMIDTIAAERVSPPAGGAAKPSITVETKVVTLYTTTERYCVFQMQSLSAKRSTARNRNARINAYGGALALLGGVAAYAPVKAVLMGFGVSSSGGSDSILGHVASTWTDDEATALSDISALRASYKVGVETYNAISPTDDPFGTKRFNVLIQIRAACDGLSAFQGVK